MKNIKWQIYGNIYNQRTLPDFYKQLHCIAISVTNTVIFWSLEGPGHKKLTLLKLILFFWLLIH